MSFHVASRKQFHNQDVFLSNKSFQSEKVLRSQAVAILKDEWRLERNRIEVWAGAMMCFSWRRKSIEYFAFPKSFSLLGKKFRPWLHAERKRSTRLSSCYLKVIKIGLNFCCVSSFIRWLASMASNSPGKGPNQTWVSCKCSSWKINRFGGLRALLLCQCTLLSFNHKLASLITLLNGGGVFRD